MVLTGFLTTEQIQSRKIGTQDTEGFKQDLVKGESAELSLFLCPMYILSCTALQPVLSTHMNGFVRWQRKQTVLMSMSTDRSGLCNSQQGQLEVPPPPTQPEHLCIALP